MKTNDKIKLSLFIVFISVVVLVILCVFLESLGVFPGSLLNKISVQRHIDENYPELEYKIESYYYNKQEDKYVFNCTIPNGDFIITSEGLKIKEDGYYEKYLKDSALLNELSDLIKEQIKEKVPVDTVEFKYKIIKGKYKDSNEALEDLNGRYELVVNIVGERLSFEDYKVIASNYAFDIKEKGYYPNVLQIFYYRNETKPVLQYESRINKSVLVLDSYVIKNSVDTHFIVELDDNQVKKYKVLVFFQKFYLVFLLLSVILLSSIWIFRKYRKLKRGKTV